MDAATLRAGASDGYEAFWRFAAKRQQLYLDRLSCSQTHPADEVLAEHRFTNAYRASDRVSQYLIASIQGANWGWLDTFCRTLVFKVFNRIETWEYVSDHVGEIDSEALLSGSIDRILDSRVQTSAIYSAAYIMPPPKGEGPKYRRHLDLLRQMVADGAHERIRAADGMNGAFREFRSWDSIGPFLAYQFATDLNYSHHLGFSECEFVMPGPGALRGLRKCFPGLRDRDPADLIRATAEAQYEEFTARGIEWFDLWGRPLQLIDVQNLFCEIDKYTRVAMPDLARFAPGQRIKQRYRPNPRPLTAVFPQRWGLNDAAAQWLSENSVSGDGGSTSRDRASRSQTTVPPPASRSAAKAANAAS